MKKSNLHFIIFVISLVFLKGCVTYDKKATYENDPYEKTNREIFKFNQGFDKHILKPASKTYEKTINKNIRKGISEHLNWISTPTTILNSGLQVKPENFAISSIDFLINSLTLGFYNLNENGDNFDKLDFGSTLAKYKIPEGPYLIVPILGPRTSRHLAGDLINYTSINSIQPNKANEINYYQRPLDAIDKRSKLSNIFEDINSSSDPYIKMRSMYIQNRRKSLFSDKEYEKNILREEEEEFEKLLQ